MMSKLLTCIHHCEVEGKRDKQTQTGKINHCDSAPVRKSGVDGGAHPYLVGVLGVALVCATPKVVAVLAWLI